MGGRAVGVFNVNKGNGGILHGCVFLNVVGLVAHLARTSQDWDTVSLIERVRLRQHPSKDTSLGGPQAADDLALSLNGVQHHFVFRTVLGRVRHEGNAGDDPVGAWFDEVRRKLVGLAVGGAGRDVVVRASGSSHVASVAPRWDTARRLPVWTFVSTIELPSLLEPVVALDSRPPIGCTRRVPRWC